MHTPSIGAKGTVRTLPLEVNPTRRSSPSRRSRSKRPEQGCKLHHTTCMMVGPGVGARVGSAIRLHVCVLQMLL